jgi:circadian clock protein KaiC
MYRSPVGLYIDQWFYELLDAVERTGARRIVIDSLTDLEFAVADELRFQEFVYSLTQRVSRSQLNLLMTFETAELAGVDRVSDFGVSRLASNVLLLEYLPSASELERTITILKTRASDHDLRRRRFAITPAGLVLGPSLTKGPPS